MAREIIDIHPHIVSTDLSRYPVTPLHGKRSDWSHERAVTFEEMVAAMDSAGVDKAALVHSSTTYGFNCDYVADAVAAYPDRFTGVFSVNVLEPDAAQKMRHWFAKGLTGQRIFSRGSTFDGAWLAIDDPRIFPCYETADELGITVGTNVTPDVFSQLETVLKRYPQVTFLLDHLAETDFSDGPPFNNAAPLLRLAQYPNLYLKVATKNFVRSYRGKSTPEAMFAILIGAFGANRMAWGSNYPSSAGSLPELLDTALQATVSLSKGDVEWLFGKTALKLYPALARKRARVREQTTTAAAVRGDRGG